MMRRLLKKINHSSIILVSITWVSLIMALIALVAITWDFFDFPCSISLPDWLTSLKSLTINLGTIFVVFILIRTLIKEVYEITWKEKRATVGASVGGTVYDFSKILDERSEEVIVVGQNIYTLFKMKKFREKIIALINNENTKVTVIGTTYTIMKAVWFDIARDFLETLEFIKEVCKKTEAKKENLRFFFHPSAISLSCIIRDPEKKRRGIMVLTAKWAKDTEPHNRFYCVLEKWENEELFNKMYSHISFMVAPGSQKLKRISQEIKTDIDSGVFNEYEDLVDGVKPALTYFISNDR